MLSIATASEFVLNILLQNEKVKQFPKDFLDASVDWVRSWFLTDDDPKAAAKLQDPDKDLAVKQDIVEDKIAALQGNPEFLAQLEAKLSAYAEHKSRIKNVVENANVDAEGSIRVGDATHGGDEGYEEKNVVRGGTFKTKGEFRVGDG